MNTATNEFKILRAAAMLLINLVVMTVPTTAQTTEALNIDDPITLGSLLLNYDCHKLDGKLAVFGTLRDDQSNPVYPAWVELRVNKVGRGSHPVREDGTYCIRYDTDKTITALVFRRLDSAATCVEEISGDRSHYINKVFDNTCSKREYPLSASALSPPETKSVFRSGISNKYLGIQINLVNITGEAVRLLTPQFEAKSPTAIAAGGLAEPSHLTPGVQPVDTQLLTAMARSQEDVVSILRFGPFALGSIRLAPSVNQTALEGLAFRKNEVISEDTAVTRIVFIPRTFTTYDPVTLSNALADLGTLVVTAHGLSSGEEFRFSNGLAEGTSNLRRPK